MRTALTVIHNPAASRFEADIAGQLALCAYRKTDGILYLTHTEVPRFAEGQGIAAELVGQTLAWARREGLRVRPACSYVASYMRRHPETRDLLAA